MFAGGPFVEVCKQEGIALGRLGKMAVEHLLALWRAQQLC